MIVPKYTIIEIYNSIYWTKISHRESRIKVLRNKSELEDLREGVETEKGQFLNAEQGSDWQEFAQWSIQVMSNAQ